MELELQGQADGKTLVVLRGPDGLVLLDAEDFRNLRLLPPPVPPQEHDGRQYYPPSAIRGCTVVIDEARQRVLIRAPAEAFDTTRLSATTRQQLPVSPASTGAFLNYQLLAQQVQGRPLGGGYEELGLFTEYGVLTSSGVARAAGGDNRFVRLDTSFNRDFPDRLETLNLGDAISDPGSWGNAVHYAGLRFSRNFALRPDLLTTPLLSAAGVATVPSTVDVFVNNQLVSSNQVSPGPFIIDRLPTVTGSGDVNVVVRDALGREQVVSQPFYTASSLLARDLTQYAVNVGSVREDYGLASDHYGGLLAEASYRRGITDELTVEGHGEYQSAGAHAAGVNVVAGIDHVATLNATAAYGGDAAGDGILGSVGIEHHGIKTSFVASTTRASGGFAQVGDPADTGMRIRQRTLLEAGTELPKAGSLAFAYVWQGYHDSPAQQTLSITHTRPLGSVGAINLMLSRTLTAASGAGPSQSSLSAYLVFVYSFGNRVSASAGAVAGRGSGAPQDEAIATLTQSPPAGPGTGYRLSASTAGNYDAYWHQQLAAADVEVEAARTEGIEGRSAQLSGALTLLDGMLTPSRTVAGSFAVVDVGGLPGVGVYVENQLVTRTDDSGRALLYNLRPYEANHVGIDPDDLPLDAVIGATGMLLTPPYRSGVVARFPVEQVRSATFRLVTEDGNPVPVGASVRLNGEDFPVVMDGMVYVTGFDRGMGASAIWPGHHCRFRLDPPDPGAVQPDLGKVICHGEAALPARLN
jgi:outer membrane usher protein